MKIPTEIPRTEVEESGEEPPQRSEGFGVILPTEKPVEEKNEDEEKTEPEEKYITEDELAMNRVSEKGIQL